MKPWIAKAKQELKEIFLTWQGWAGWIIANVITSLHWVTMIVIGFITKDTTWYASAAAAWALGMSPLIPLWIVNIMLASLIKNLLLKNKRGIVIKGGLYGKSNS